MRGWPHLTKKAIQLQAKVTRKFLSTETRLINLTTSRGNNPQDLESIQSGANASADDTLIGHYALPAKPLVIIEPAKSWLSLNLGDLWAYRELLYFLTWRDVKVRYKQTLLGVAWAIIQPLFSMLIFTLFFGKLAGLPSDGIPYPLFAYSGLLLWTFFSNTVTTSGNSLVGNANLVTKVYFPRMIIPAAAVAAGMVDLIIGFTLLIFLAAYYAISIDLKILLAPVLVLLLSFTALSVGMLMSALNVKYRDIRHALPFLVQVWMFVTPIIYPSSIVPEKWRWVLMLNPLTGIIEGFRSTLFNKPIGWQALTFSFLLTAVLLAYAAYTFKRMERTFADII